MTLALCLLLPLGCGASSSTTSPDPPHPAPSVPVAEPDGPDPVMQRPTCAFADDAKPTAVEVQTCIDAHLDSLSTCYIQALVRDRDARGTAKLDFIVALDGALEDAGVRVTGFDDPAFVDCSTSALAGWRFPERGAGEPLQVVGYPVDLQAH